MKATAERVLSEVVGRIHTINADDHYAFRVKAVRVFGSMLTDASNVGDIDLAIQLEPRHEDQERQRNLCWSRRGDRRFSSALAKGMWPYEEVLKSIKGRSPLVSIHRWEEPDELCTTSRVIWESPSREVVHSYARLGHEDIEEDRDE